MPESALPLDGFLNCHLLIFDLDGTLIDSTADLTHAVNATLAHLHRPPLAQSRVAEFVGDGAAVLVRRALDDTGGSNDALLDAAIPFFLAYYRVHKLDFTFVYPGVIAALERIRSANPDLPMAVLTNKPVGPSRDICDGLCLSPFLFANYGGNSFQTKKPDPAGVHTLLAEAATRLGHAVLPKKTVLIGDSHVDVQTARAAGILCLGCSYGLDPEGLRHAGPDLTVASPDEWVHALQTLVP